MVRNGPVSRLLGVQYNDHQFSDTDKKIVTNQMFIKTHPKDADGDLTSISLVHKYPVRKRQTH